MKKSVVYILILVLMASLCAPSYAADLFEDLKDYGGNILDVPAAHPRIFFTKTDIPQIIANSRNSENREAMKAFNQALLKETYNVLDENSDDNANNYILFSIQAKAFNHAVFGGDSGQDAVISMIDYLKKYKFPEHDFSAMQSYHQVTYTVYNASLVYDWCYDILTTEQEVYLRTKLLELADAEHDFNSLTNGLSPFGGTGTSNYIFRDFLSLGIALYDTNPEIFNFIYSQINEVYKPIDEYFSKSHSSFYGYQYGAFALYGHTMAYRMMDAVGYKKIFTDDMFHALDYYMLCRLPDGNNLIEGDDYLRAKGEYKRSMDDSALTMISAAASHYLKDNKFKSYLRDLSLTHTAFWYGTICFTPIDSILLIESQGTVSEHVFPKSNYFSSPMGMIIASHGEEDNKAVIKMKISEGYKWHHQHLDAGSFEIYYKGRLTGQSAQYSRTDIDQYSNYYVQSIASNTLLIKDPDETFTYWNSFEEAENSGGQRIKRTGARNLKEWLSNESYNLGKVTGYYSSDELSYLAGDITNSYSDKVSEVKRYMMFTPEEKGGIMFIIDKINSADSSFKKTFLLHAPSEPSVSGNTVVLSRKDDNCNGRLTMKSVYPEVEISPVGGEGRQWYVNGTNYEPLESYAPELSKDPYAYGWGRIEVSPKEEKTLDYFVNVLYIDDADADAAPDASAIEGTHIIGAETNGKAVVIATSTEREENTLSFPLKSASDVKVANIAEGFWNVFNDNELIACEYSSEESGMIAFSAKSGNIRLEYAYDDMFSGGYGTEAVPYIIKTAEDFKNIASLDNEGVYYKQACDINLGNYTPFEFRGNYDGNNKVLNISINGTDDSGTGLFSVLSKSASLKNITVTGSVSGTNYVGGIAGKISNAEKITVENCINKANVSGSGARIGGIIGDLYMDNKLSDSKIKLDRLENTGNISGDYWVAGIAGVCKVTLKNMKNTGTVTGKGSAGGIAGLTYSVISDSANCGEISGSPAGGIAGHIIIGSVNNSFNYGNILKNKYKVTGGIVGLSDRGGVSYCYDAGYLHNADAAIIGQINDSKGTTTVKNCFYLNPENKKGIGGSYPLTDSQLRSLTINSSYQKTTTAYPYPQLKNISPFTDGAELTEAEVKGEMCDIYPAKGRIYIKKNSDITFTVYPHKYCKISSVYLNGKKAELIDQSITVSGINSNIVFEALLETVAPVIRNPLVFGDVAKAGDFLPVIDDYINYKDDYYCIIYSKAEGIFSDCGFLVSADGENYKNYTAYKTGVTEHTFGVYFHSKKMGKYYIKPYVKDNDGHIYYGQQTEVQLMSLEK